LSVSFFISCLALFLTVFIVWLQLGEIKTLLDSHLHLLGEDGDVIALGADDLGLDVTFLLVGNPTVLLAVERLVLLLLKLLLVRRQVLVVGVVWRNLRHLDTGSTRYTRVTDQRLLQVHTTHVLQHRSLITA